MRILRIDLPTREAFASVLLFALQGRNSHPRVVSGLTHSA